MSQTPERSIAIKTSSILKIIGVLVALWFFWLVRDILALLFVALFLAGLMHPAARWAARFKIPKGITVLCIYFIMFGLLASALALIIPTLIEQIGNLSRTIGSSLTAISNSVQNLQQFSQQHGLAGNLSSGVASIQNQVQDAASGLLSALTDVFGGIAGLVIVLAMAFYMVVEERQAVRMFHNLVPDKYQERSANIISQVEEKMGQWLGGQLLLSLIIGVLYYLGLLVLGIDSALALSFFGAFTEFVPYLGPILGGIPVVLIAFNQSPFKGLLALGLVILVQQLENQIIVPKVMQKAVGLNPLVSIVAVLIGAKLFGIVGALLAIPLATALSVVLNELYHYRQEA